MFATWVSAIRRIAAGVASYAVGIALLMVSGPRKPLVYAIGGTVVAGLLFVEEIYINIRPERRINELAPIALDGVAEPLLAQLKTIGAVARINLMMPTRTWRWMRLRRYFKMRWSRGMDNQPDVNLSFRLKYGITGECFRTRQPVYAGPDEIRKPEFALPRHLTGRTPDLQVIFSYPVYEVARKGHPQSGKVIGVLNLDSITPNGYNILTESAVFDATHQTMQNIATIAARFYR
jgi:hypothetical protein